MRQELRSPLERTYLTIEPVPTDRWIDVNWMGYLTGDNIRTGAAAYTAALAESGYHAVLNDTRAVLGPWEHSLDWVINTWAPQAAEAGLTHFAMITTRESMADATAVAFYQQLTSFKAEMFSNMEEAKQWLRQFSLAR
ncbi:STAS/SEC14 domain-containing protein [Hymenobacter elongatus]|uniref:STAS/SEC14 domain-containing protein n=1 Tax=Hymenobacter elongatus TaxID=877208 RepID=A0A4Z0PF03_9BACT|nr:STAS/SEC14 domain-containing protein [Hymenobacter elongatus]TGE13431.1 STAS/SEC14 domain-containing protein [Hymenobacter elongatus]